jgi:hypothetical protein
MRRIGHTEPVAVDTSHDKPGPRKDVLLANFSSYPKTSRYVLRSGLEEELRGAPRSEERGLRSDCGLK